ncbi:hypothetical protein C8F01DRAFT_1031628 [Mycena amicta]|nr:hypothetical protein C8F01DRAFT_1031628 [Mycena amicta]
MSVPDEIISEILSPALKVSDDAFADMSPKSPFANYTESSSAYLLVCKSWLRVATPLLYNVVILRSKAQARALERSLSQNKELGRFIKKLRVEGGFGPSMHSVLRCAPNISDLYLTLEVYSPDTTEGLCAGLKLINPIRFILSERQSGALKNNMVLNLTKAVAEAIKGWDRLRFFHCQDLNYSERTRGSILDSLASTACVHTVVVPWLLPAKSMKEWLQACPLREIIIAEPVPLQKLQHVLYQELLASTNPIVKYTVEGRGEGRAAGDDNSEWTTSASAPPHIAPFSNPLFTPMAAEPQEVQDSIWSRIVYFAMNVPQRTVAPIGEASWGMQIRGLGRENLNLSNPRIGMRRLLCVSQRFHFVGLPHYYAHVTLRDECPGPESLRRVLAKYPTLGAQIQTLRGVFECQLDHAGGDSMNAVLSRTTSLRRIVSLHKDPYRRPCLYSEVSISWAAFNTVVIHAGATLTEFSASINATAPAVPVSSNVFAELTALEKLDWTCKAPLKGNVDANSLRNLRQLRVNEVDASFFLVFSAIRLPSLTQLVLFPECTVPEHTFWQSHGHGARLVDLEISHHIVESLRTSTSILDLCPNLQALVVGWAEPNFMIPTPNEIAPLRKEDLVSYQPAIALLKITFKVYFRLRPYEHTPEGSNSVSISAKAVLTSWEKFFLDFPLDSLPNLREIVVTCFRWPQTEHEISKSGWVRAAERLLKHQVTIADEHGKKWRARLKFRGKTEQ